MMLVSAGSHLDFISDKLTASFLLVIGLIAFFLFINTTNDPSLITNSNHPAGVDTIFVFGFRYFFSLALAISFRVDDETMCR